MADDTIFQRIAFEGGDEIVGKLKEIGKAGEEVFASLGDGIVGVVEALVGLGAAFLGVGAALGTLAKLSADAAKEMGDLAQQTGTTVEDISGLRGALIGLGGGTENLAAQFRKMSVVIEQAWEEIKKSSAATKDQQINDNLAIIKSNEAVVQSTLGIQSASLSLEQAKLNLKKATGQDVDPEIENQLKVKQARQAVAEAEAKQQEAVLKLQEAEQKQAEAAQKADEDRRNSLQAVATAVKGVVDGVETLKQAGQQANLSVENITKGLVINAGPASEQLKLFAGNIHDLSNQAPPVRKVFSELADLFKNSGDAALNTAIAYKFFGRSVSQDFIEALSKGSAVLDAERDRLEKLGLVVTKPQEEIGKELVDAFGKLSNAVQVTGQQIGLLFAPAFTAGFEKLNDVIERNHQAIIDFATGIKEQAEPIIIAFFKLLTGEELSKEDPAWIKTIVEGTKTIVKFIEEKVIPLFLDFFRLLAGEDLKTPWLDNIVKAFSIIAEVTGALVKVIKEAFLLILESINATFGEKTIKIFDSFSGAVAALLDLIKRALSPVIALFSALSDAINTLRSKLPESNTAIVDPKPVQETTTALHGMADAVHGVGEESKKAADAAATFNDRFKAASTGTAGPLTAAGLLVSGFREKLIQLGGDGASAFNIISTSARDANPNISIVKASVLDLQAALRAAAEAPSGRVKLGSEFIDAEKSIQAVKDGIVQVRGLLQGPFPAFKPSQESEDGAKKVLGDIKELSQQSADGIKQNLDKGIMQVAWDKLNTGAQSAAEEVTKDFTQSALDIKDAFDKAVQGSTFDSLKQKAEETFNTIKGEWSISPTTPDEAPDVTWSRWLNNIESKAEEVFRRIKQLASEVQPPGGGTVNTETGASGFAAGGPVFGPRGIDKIPAWLTHGEFVVQAPAVRWIHAQMPDFLHAINAFRLPALPRFALGGLVGALPAFGAPSINVHAATSPAASQGQGRPIVLSFDGGARSFAAFVEADVAESLERFAASKQMRRTSRLGKSPDWKK